MGGGGQWWGQDGGYKFFKEKGIGMH